MSLVWDLRVTHGADRMADPRADERTAHARLAVDGARSGGGDVTRRRRHRIDGRQFWQLDVFGMQYR